MGKRIVSVLLCALLLCLCAGCGSYKADASFTYLLEQNVISLGPPDGLQQRGGAGHQLLV